MRMLTPRICLKGNLAFVVLEENCGAEAMRS